MHDIIVHVYEDHTYYDIVGNSHNFNYYEYETSPLYNMFNICWVLERIGYVLNQLFHMTQWIPTIYRHCWMLALTWMPKMKKNRHHSTWRQKMAKPSMLFVSVISCLTYVEKYGTN